MYILKYSIILIESIFFLSKYTNYKKLLGDTYISATKKKLGMSQSFISVLLMFKNLIFV
jgi:hypothetical protein